ncbi:MAG TPA: endolytic transglycosylase MltG [Burkholderiaceae bacterium]|nr:endolytic transglycosylase MltG [Burkholderiaceae bacterium]
MKSIIGNRRAGVARARLKTPPAIPLVRGWRLIFLLLFVAVTAAGYYVWHAYKRPLDMPAERVEVRIAAGSSARAIARQLQQVGVGIDAEAFVVAARATGATQSLRAGRYEVARGMNLLALVDKLRRGDVLRERVTIVEGSTFAEMRATLAAHPELRKDTANMSDAELLRAVGAEESHPEGLFAPETYVFDTGSSDLDVLRQAYRAQRAVLQQAWENRAEGLPYRTAYEALIMASIVEKETGAADERARIAGVFVNRLQKGMLLQTDPTVIYGLGPKFDGNLHKRDLTTDTPYNTYTRGGLPPTPIALPSRASITAALKPEETRALYFVSRGDGTSEFSETLTDHNRAVGKYQLGAR